MLSFSNPPLLSGILFRSLNKMQFVNSCYEYTHILVSNYKKKCHQNRLDCNEVLCSLILNPDQYLLIPVTVKSTVTR